MIKLGVEAKDIVTGFSGVVTAKYTFLTGCDRYQLTPKVGKDGVQKDSCAFDENSLEVTGEGVSNKFLTSQSTVSSLPQKKHDDQWYINVKILRSNMYPLWVLCFAVEGCRMVISAQSKILIVPPFYHLLIIIMKARILKINGGEAYDIKVGDIIEVEKCKFPMEEYYTSKHLVGNQNRKPIFDEEDIEIIK